MVVVTNRAYIGLGANLGDARATVERAIAALASLGTVVRRSSLYRTAPWGKLDQPDFVNAVVLLETALEPEALLGELQRLEREFGRVRGERWGPRMLDLDILTYGDIHLATTELEIPHPRMLERAFVLVPLAEVDATYAAARDAAADPSAVLEQLADV